MSSLLKTITELKIIDLQKERLEIIYDYKKNQTIASSFPSVFSVIGTVKYLGDAAASFVTKDYTGGATKATQGFGILASSITSSYYTHKSAKDTLTADYLTEKYELEYKQIRLLSEMLRDSFSYQAEYANENKVESKYLLNEQLAESFASTINGEDKGRALAYLKGESTQYKYFPRYWLELAGLYYQNGLYEKCVETIDYYNANFDYKQIYRTNIRYGQILVYGIASCLNINMEDKALLEKIIPWLEVIIKQTADDDWYQRYYCAMTYLMVFDKTGEEQYLRVAYDLIQKNINFLYERQKKGAFCYFL